MAELFFNLQLFSEGGEAATGETAEAPTAEQGVQAEAPPAEDRSALYAKFKAEFKDEYNAEVQAAIKDRLKKSKSELQSYKDAEKKITPLLDTMAARYGVDANDYDKLMAAVEADDKLYEDEAYERGMTVEQVKEWHRIERENRMLRAQDEQRAKEAQWEAQCRIWDAQFAELKSIYPNVDPRVEMQNPSFVQLMDAGVPIRTAFEVTHLNELTRGAMQFTANKVAEKMTNAAIANASHPQENMSKQAAAVTQPNIQSMTLEDWNKYANKAKAGGKVDLVNHY